MHAIVEEIPIINQGTVFLNYTTGEVEPYKGFELPDQLKKPLARDSFVRLSAYRSGDRTALIKVGEDWFKLKGINPSSNRYYGTDEPEGGVSKKRAYMEITCNERIHNGYTKYGYNGPLIPVAKTRYDVPFLGDHVYNVISKTFGDIRVHDIHTQIWRKISDFGPENLARFTKSINEWMGFSHKVLKEQNITSGEIPHNTNNFVLYNLKNGYGISRIDFGSANISNDAKVIDEFVRRGVGKLETFIFPFAFFTFSSKLNLNPAELLQNPYAVEVVEIENFGNERVKRTDDGMTTFYVCKDRFSEMMESDNVYRNAYDGEIIPQPIDRRLIQMLFN